MNLLVTQCNIQLITVIITYFIKISPCVNQHTVTKSRGGRYSGLPGKRVGFESPLIPVAQFSLLRPCAPPTEAAHTVGGQARSAGADAALARNTVWRGIRRMSREDGRRLLLRMPGSCHHSVQSCMHTGGAA